MRAADATSPEDDPRAATWGVPLEREIAGLRSDVMIVGHSLGGTVPINFLTEHAPPVGLAGIVLIAAPFVGEGGWKRDDIRPRTDLAERLPKDVPA